MHTKIIEFKTERYAVRDDKGDWWSFIGEVIANCSYDRDPESGFLVDSLTVKNCIFYRLDETPNNDMKCETLATAPDCFPQRSLAELESTLESEAKEMADAETYEDPRVGIREDEHDR